MICIPKRRPIFRDAQSCGAAVVMPEFLVSFEYQLISSCFVYLFFPLFCILFYFFCVFLSHLYWFDTFKRSSCNLIMLPMLGLT